MKYFAITFDLSVLDLGEHDSFDSADSCAASAAKGEEVLYIASLDSLVHLRRQIDEVIEPSLDQSLSLTDERTSLAPETDKTASAIGKLAAEWRFGLKTAASFVANADAEFDRLRTIEVELNEQARLLGMSAEREASLLGKIDSLQRKLDNYSDELKTDK